MQGQTVPDFPTFYHMPLSNGVQKLLDLPTGFIPSVLLAHHLPPSPNPRQPYHFSGASDTAEFLLCMYRVRDPTLREVRAALLKLSTPGQQPGDRELAVPTASKPEQEMGGTSHVCARTTDKAGGSDGFL